MRVETENGSTGQSGRSLLDATNIAVAVFHRVRKAPLLKGRPHPIKLAGRNCPVEDQRLGSPADAGVERSNQDLVLAQRRQALAADFAPTRANDPKRKRLIGKVGHDWRV